jgi:nucleoside-diphosphate-sugar epimerase
MARPPSGTVLITGASGTLGTALTAFLSEHSDHRVVCLSRSPLTDLPPGCVEITGDFASRTDLQRLSDRVGQISVCVHLGGVLSQANGEDLQLQVNVVGTHALITHLHDHDTQKFVLASSIAAVGCLSPSFRPLQLPMPDDHTSLDVLGYGGSKYLMEEMSRLVCRQNPGIDVINLRIAGIVSDDAPPRHDLQPHKPGTIVQFGIMCVTLCPSDSGLSRVDLKVSVACTVQVRE